MSESPLCGILPVDKAPDWTSHDVVAKTRGLLGQRRVGHAGTLDPMATGLLVVLAGKATRLMELLLGEKTYQARLRLGFTSDTLDAQGDVRPTGAALPPPEEVYAVLPRFLGGIEQIPPMVSAVKVGGQRLYKLARQGVEIERKPRPVTVRALELSEADGGDLALTVTCSSGTYIRTLIADIGNALGCGAVMTALRRVRSGALDIGQAVTLEELSRRKAAGEAPETWLLTVRAALPDLPALTLTEREELALYQGKTLPGRPLPAQQDGLCWLLDTSGTAIALAKAERTTLKLHINLKT